MLRSNREAQSKKINDSCEYSSTYGETDYQDKMLVECTKLISLLDLYHHKLGILKPKSRRACDLADMESDIVNVLTYILPHGSGVDCHWEFDVLKNGNIVCYNSYHCMNQDGYYDGWVDFRVKIFRHTKDVYSVLSGTYSGKTQVIHRKGDLDFTLTGDFHLRWNKYSYIKDYLWDIIAECLRPILTNHNKILKTK